MSGWKTWAGVIAAAITSLSLFLGLELTDEQIAGIQTLILGLIGWGLGHKADKNKQATEEVSEQATSLQQAAVVIKKETEVIGNAVVGGVKLKK